MPAREPRRQRRTSIDDDELLAELAGADGADDITVLRHVRTSADKRAAEEIAQRKPCEDFETFKPLFERVKRELKSGVRQTRPRSGRSTRSRLPRFRQGEFFIVDGQIAYVAEVGEEFRTQYERKDSRLRVIYDNGTESDVLQRSFQRALHRDAAARLITNPAAGPLFGDEPKPTISPAARSTFCAASPTIRSSRPTAMSCTRSASPAGRSRPASPTRASTPPSCWPTSRSSPPTSSTTSTA